MPSYLVTGANRNLGLAIVRGLAANPKNIVIALNRTLSTEPIPNVKEVQGDLGNLDSLKIAVAKVSEIIGGSLDTLICNAVHPPSAPVPMGEGREEDLAATLREAFFTNTVGNLQLVSLLLPLLRKGEKKIIHITSGAGVPKLVVDMNLQGRVPLGVSKGGLNIALAQLSNQFRPEKFSIVSVSPALLGTRETFKANGMDYDATHAWLARTPGFSGILSLEDGVKVLLDTIQRMGPGDSGKVVGMWGSDDKWV